MQAVARSSAPGGGPSVESSPAPGGGSGSSARVLVIEDEPGIVDFLRRGLEAEGYAVESALDGLDGERRALGGGFDVVVLDLMLPGRSGLEVLASLRRARPALPVIVLTARGEVEDRVAGLDAGAVDYLVKPFSLVELLARVRAHLRVSARSHPSTLKGADIELDLITRKVRRGGRTIPLSPTEFELLSYLMHHRGQAVSRGQMLCAVW